MTPRSKTALAQASPKNRTAASTCSYNLSVDQLLLDMSDNPPAGIWATAAAVGLASGVIGYVRDCSSLFKLLYSDSRYSLLELDQPFLSL